MNHFKLEFKIKNKKGSFTMSPDMIKLSLTIKNTKELLSDAKESVERRYEYIFQTLKRYRIKVLFCLILFIIYSL